MLNKDSQLLEEAYLSVAKKSPNVPSDDEPVTPEVVDAGPMDGPAPGVDVQVVDSEDTDTTGVPVDMEAVGGEDPRLSVQDEVEEDDMSIDNLSSIRDSIMKIAAHCAGSGHLEPWQQQKLAIAMDNLAEIARRIR